MKIISQILLFAIFMVSCKKDDNNIVQVNTAPEAFALLTIEHEEEQASLSPTFTWQPATDVDGDSVVYDFYLETQNYIGAVPTVDGNPAPADPTILVAQGITETNFTIPDPLPINTPFTWKVVARDNQGGSVESEIFRFSTRPLNLSENAHTPNAGFDVRQGHGSVFFKDKFWVIGGFANIEESKNDVWSSTDGKNWVLENADAEFSGRSHFGITVFQDRIFILGGSSPGGLLADVWSSADGVTWIQENDSPEFSARTLTKLVSLENKIYAIGGLESPFDATTGSAEEVWSSTNGADWVLETDTAPYLARYGFEALVFNNKIFIIGGALATTQDVQTDSWFSINGKNWTKTKYPENLDLSSFTFRNYFNVTVYKNKIWLAGGFYKNKHYNDLWSSSDGIFWIREAADAGFEARSFSTLVSNLEYMLLIGGEQSGTNNKLNDVWKFD